MTPKRQLFVDIMALASRAEKADAAVEALTRDRDEARAILGNPSKWMHWCDARMLERAETAEASTAAREAAITALIEKWREQAQEHDDAAESFDNPSDPVAVRQFGFAESFRQCADDLASLLKGDPE